MLRVSYKKILFALCMFFTVSNLYTDNENFVLITSLYNEKNHARIAEYITCLEKNLVHPLIAKIHVLYDTGNNPSEASAILDFLQSKNIEISNIVGRATFQYCFDLANNLYPNNSIIVSNADIYFNETLGLLTHYSLENKFLALTRWNIQKDGGLTQFYQNGKPNQGSQDTWIFTTPLKKFKNANIQIGTWYCDGRIAYEAKQVGLQVTNPCKSIQCCHLHLSGIRHYNQKKPAGGTSQTAWDLLRSRNKTKVISQTPWCYLE